MGDVVNCLSYTDRNPEAIFLRYLVFLVLHCFRKVKSLAYRVSGMPTPTVGGNLFGHDIDRLSIFDQAFLRLPSGRLEIIFHTVHRLCNWLPCIVDISRGFGAFDRSNLLDQRIGGRFNSNCFPAAAHRRLAFKVQELCPCWLTLLSAEPCLRR